MGDVPSGILCSVTEQCLASEAITNLLRRDIIMRAFINGHFVSCEEENRFFSVLVEEHGKIVFTGNNLPDIYRDVKAIDLEGRCVIPCFGDTHLHFTSMCYTPLDVRGFDNIPMMLEKIRNYCKTAKEKVIISVGISENGVKERRLPTRLELDSCTDRPFALAKYDGHAGVMNTKFMELCPDEIKNHKDFNKDNGSCYSEAFAMLLVFVGDKGLITPMFTLNNMPRVINKLASLGINLITPVEGLGANQSPYDIVNTLDRQTPIRVKPFFQTMEAKDGVAKGCERVGGCFVNQLDGCFGAEDAALREPYTNNPNNKGWLTYDQETVDKFVIEANRAGMQIAIHAIGDAAIVQAIIAFEKALTDFPREDHRHTIIHADLFPKEYLDRAGKLGLYCAIQTPFLTWKEEPLEYLEKIIGDRAFEKHPLPLMLESGLILANGSDCPCTEVNPLMGLYSCCNHPNPKYRIDIITALKMHTLNCAKLAFLEKEMGSLMVGKVADFIVLDRDITSIETSQILNVKILGVYFGGKKYDKKFKLNKISLLVGMIKGKRKYQRNIKK